MVKKWVLYTSHKIHPFLKFTEIDETSVNLFHNYNKSDCNLMLDVSICAILTCQSIFVPVPAFADFFSSLVQLTVYCYFYKERFAAFHLSREGAVLC